LISVLLGRHFVLTLFMNCFFLYRL
jgi:hypothetical protein